MIVACWSGPRNISTALMRSWSSRSDTFITDEPFYAYYLKETKLKKLRLINLDLKEEKVFLKNLYKLGYNKINSSKSNFNNIKLIKTFQRRFRQKLINGLLDKECLVISKNLIKQ